MLVKIKSLEEIHCQLRVANRLARFRSSWYCKRSPSERRADRQVIENLEQLLELHTGGNVAESDVKKDRAIGAAIEKRRRELTGDNRPFLLQESNLTRASQVAEPGSTTVEKIEEPNQGKDENR